MIFFILSVQANVIAKAKVQAQKIANRDAVKSQMREANAVRLADIEPWIPRWITKETFSGAGARIGGCHL